MLRVLALLALLAAPLAHAQDDDTPLRDGARALVFAVGPDLTLNGLDGGSIGVKWHRSEERAVRLGVTVSAAAIAQFGPVDSNQQFAFASVTVVPLRYRRSRTPVYLYTGIGPTAQFQVRRSGAEGQDGGRWASNVEVGAVGIVGVEWVVAEAIGLTGEYGQALTVGGAFASEEEFRLSFSPRGARLGVAVYF